MPRKTSTMFRPQEIAGRVFTSVYQKPGDPHKNNRLGITLPEVGVSEGIVAAA